MVKPVQKAEISSFVKGFVTEHSPLNFPPDACKDIENFILNRDGSLQRREGIDFEEGYNIRTTLYPTSQFDQVATSTFRWKGPGGDLTKEFGVVQIGSHLDIYDLANNVLSATGYLATVDLSGQLFFNNLPISYATIDGMLIMATGQSDPLLLVYNGGSSFTMTPQPLKVRDLWGLPETGVAANDRPAVLTNYHKYNLYNQGWGIPRKTAAGTLNNPITIYNSALGVYPAHTETVYTGLKFQPVTGGVTFERVYPNLYEEVLGLSGTAAKGYFIIDLLRRGTTRKSEADANAVRYPLIPSISSPLADITSPGPSAVVDFAGRVFYAGFNGSIFQPEVNSPDLSSYVVFTQVVKSKDELVKCYQEGDPTSRENNDIIDTDGGFVRISGVKKIMGLRVMANNLFIFADNGVWMIAGGSDFGFTATNYRVDRISSFGCFAPNSILEVGDKTFFWGDEGIFVTLRNEVGDWVCENITEGNIQTYYNSITSEARREVKGVYDANEKQIRWLFEEGGFWRELVLDTKLGAYSKIKFYELPANTPNVLGYIITPSYNSLFEDIGVDAGGVGVVAGGVGVVVNTEVRESRELGFKYLVSTPGTLISGNVGYTFAEFSNESFLDWFSVTSTGVDATAFLLTGTVTAGDTAISKQVPYLVMHFMRTEDGVETVGGELVPMHQSSCQIRSQWNWADSIVSGNFGNFFEAYRYKRPLFITGPADEYDNGFETVITKNKLRGRGKAVALHMQTSPLKDCHILGWSLALTGNSL